MLRCCVRRLSGGLTPNSQGIVNTSLGSNSRMLPSQRNKKLFGRGKAVHMYANVESAWANEGTMTGYERVKEMFDRIRSIRNVKSMFAAGIVLLIGGGSFLMETQRKVLLDKGLVGTKKKQHRSRLTVVFDVDETILSFGDKAYRLGGGLVLRPHLTELLDYLTQIDAEVILWAASSDRYMTQVVKAIDPNGDRISALITRDKTWYSSDAYYEKNIAWLKRNENDTIIFENRPLSIRNCNGNGVLVEDFIRGEYLQDGQNFPANDRALLEVKQIIMDLEKSGKSVPEYLNDPKERYKGIKEIPCHYAFRQLPEELARGVFFFLGNKYSPGGTANKPLKKQAVPKETRA